MTETRLASSFVDQASDALPLTLVPASSAQAWIEAAEAPVQAWLTATLDKPGAGKAAVWPGPDGLPAGAVGFYDEHDGPWAFGFLPGQLPAGTYTLSAVDGPTSTAASLGWALGTYAFDRYKTVAPPKAKLVWPKDAERDEVMRLAEAIYLVRDLITTPAEDMGPTELEDAAREMAHRHDARVKVLLGDALLAADYPAIHAVGRASDDEPRLIDIAWGRADAPKVTLVGKGVCFDTGGLDIKPAAGMLLMKKDMGGAAHVLGLAHAVMSAGLDVRLRVLVPAVENAVAGNAMRPGDVLSTRKGLTVEVGNTDAEGRLILCDALAEAAAESPEVLIDFATLTGAARVALGTELPALFVDNDILADDILAAGNDSADPLWRMPLFQKYRRHLKSTIADVNNISSTRFGGAITAALFLQHFVDGAGAWAHIDLMAYNNASRPGRPAGGEAMGLIAVYEALKRRYPAA